LAYRQADEGPSPNVEEIACACISARAPSSERVPAKKTERTLSARPSPMVYERLSPLLAALSPDLRFCPLVGVISKIESQLRKLSRCLYANGKSSLLQSGHFIRIRFTSSSRVRSSRLASLSELSGCLQPFAGNGLVTNCMPLTISKNIKHPRDSTLRPARV
jgi:hypothetical protein